MSRYDLFTFGETMVRFSTRVGERLETSQSLDLHIGGTESNLAVAMARLGRRTAWSSALPRNPLGERIARELTWHGVNTDHVHWADDGRVGLYFLDTGTGLRATHVIYDRRDSAVARLDASEFDVSPVHDAGILHLTGITPALGDGCVEICRHLMHEANSAGKTFSFDVNYRSKLWTPEQARGALTPFCEGADILFCGRDDVATIWGITGTPSDIVKQVSNRFGNRISVVTLGEDGAIMQTASGEQLAAPSFPVDFVDQVGAGDAFAAGFLHGYLDGDLDRALEYAVAMAALKMGIRGDLAIISPADLDAVVSRHGGGIVR